MNSQGDLDAYKKAVTSEFNPPKVSDVLAAEHRKVNSDFVKHLGLEEVNNEHRG